MIPVCSFWDKFIIVVVVVAVVISSNRHPIVCSTPLPLNKQAKMDLRVMCCRSKRAQERVARKQKSMRMDELPQPLESDRPFPLIAAKPAASPRRPTRRASNTNLNGRSAAISFDASAVVTINGNSNNNSSATEEVKPPPKPSKSMSRAWKRSPNKMPAGESANEGSDSNTNGHNHNNARLHRNSLTNQTILSMIKTDASTPEK
jgi:hypothetical protein